MTEQKRLGTLVVVVMEARNLSTRDIIGKGDPFSAFHLDGTSKRTKADIRGGQHPKWDDEVRFTVMKNTSKRLKLQVFNEDKRDPVLIGDATIDLNEVLDKSEWDAWHPINFRNKYAGEVSLEMTFYYDEPPPQKVVQNQRPRPMNNPSLSSQPSSYPNTSTASHISPLAVNKPPSAPPGYPPSNVYPPNTSSNVYPPPNSVSPPPNVYPPNSTSPPPTHFGPKRTQSPVSSQYPPSSSSGFQPYPPPQQSQVYPPSYPPISSPPFRPTTAPPQHDSSQGANLAFPIPIPTPGINDSGFGAYPPPRPPSPLPGYQQAYPPNNPYPPNNNNYPPAYPPASGGSMYPPPNNTYNQGYPPNTYPPNGPF